MYAQHAEFLVQSEEAGYPECLKESSRVQCGIVDGPVLETHIHDHEDLMFDTDDRTRSMS